MELLSTSDLTEPLQEIEKVLGLERTLLLINTYGGSKIYVPTENSSKSRITRDLGMEIAQILVDNFGGEYIYIAKAAVMLMNARNKELRAARSELSVHKLARKFDLSERQVFNICRQGCA
jgi:hypothetical protein